MLILLGLSIWMYVSSRYSESAEASDTIMTLESGTLTSPGNGENDPSADEGTDRSLGTGTDEPEDEDQDNETSMMTGF